MISGKNCYEGPNGTWYYQYNLKGVRKTGTVPLVKPSKREAERWVKEEKERVKTGILVEARATGKTKDAPAEATFGWLVGEYMKDQGRFAKNKDEDTRNFHRLNEPEWIGAETPISNVNTAVVKKV